MHCVKMRITWFPKHSPSCTSFHATHIHPHNTQPARISVCAPLCSPFFEKKREIYVLNPFCPHTASCGHPLHRVGRPLLQVSPPTASAVHTPPQRAQRMLGGVNSNGGAAFGSGGCVTDHPTLCLGGAVHGNVETDCTEAALFAHRKGNKRGRRGVDMVDMYR